jgi:DnaJ-class molecular chaperone
MADFEQIDEARQLLGLGETATSKQIKQAYKKAANHYHPDRCKDENKVKCEEMMKKVNEAYELIAKYCAQYSYSFSEESVRRAYPHDEYLRKYRRGWFDGI